MIETVETYEYDRNRRYVVERGTRCAVVNLYINLKSPQNRDLLFTRTFFTQKAIEAAAVAWINKWGDLPWDLVQISVTHVTAQVVVELRVDPL